RDVVCCYSLIYLWGEIIVSATFHEGVYPNDQFSHKKRFGQIVICTTVKSFYFVFQFTESSKHQYGSFSIKRSEIPAQVKSCFTRQVNVHDNTVESSFFQHPFC